MASWRDSASQEAQADLDGLVDTALTFARQELDNHGEFYPYGVALSDVGELRMVAGYGGGDNPTSAAIYETLVAGLREDSESLRAAGLVANARTDASDAVQVELEHRDGDAIVVQLPYKKKRFGRGIDYGDLAASSNTRRIWDA